MPKENLLPHKVDPFRFAENEIRLEGTLLIKDMHRLAASVNNDTGKVDVKVNFGVDEQGIHFIRGQYVTHLMLQCQRCMEDFGFDMTGHFLLGIVHTEEEADQLPKGYDSIIAKEGELIIQDVVEDELIVGLPIVPMHNLQDCKIKLPLALDSTEEVESEKENPFKVIEILRAKRNLNK